MNELRALVERARCNDLEAFGMIVRRFQDMALAYAYSLLGDFHLAEDAAQEAFVQAHSDLNNLRDSAAFPGWFRKIVFKHCDRIRRKRNLQTVPLESVVEVATNELGPAAVVEQREMRTAVLDAIAALPDNERIVTTLFYIKDYTQKDIAAFLDVPVSTVNNRLHSSRARLKERMVRMVNDELKSHALPKDFPERIQKLLQLPKPLEVEGHPIRELWHAFRSCFPDFREVELDEICKRSDSLLAQDAIENHTYSIDDDRILRHDLTSQLVRQWLESDEGACRLITVGRVFRPVNTETKTILEVHHQAEVLWIDEGLDRSQLDDTVAGVIAQILPGIEIRSSENENTTYPFIHNLIHYDLKWNNSWTRFGSAGDAEDEWLIKAGLDPERFGAISFAIGLERCALALNNLDDIRKLWHPPYVPE